MEQLQLMLPRNKEIESWFPVVSEKFREYEINTANRIAGFMAQTGHESADFTVTEENLNYSVSALNRVFPRYFGVGKRNAAEYARNPEKLANYVYMDEFRSARGALGNTRPGDGWKFRGGGIKQLTGRNNYAAFGASIWMTADQAASYVRSRLGSLESACWFWETNKISRFADRDDIVGMSRAINGGNIGLEDRQNRYVRAKNILTEEMQIGATGNLVKDVQRKLGLSADGIFGADTRSAVVAWQKTHNYSANGKLTQSQIAKILGSLK